MPATLSVLVGAHPPERRASATSVWSAVRWRQRAGADPARTPSSADRR
ncbi:hypothetical protein [Geodermatophilus maliterrae]|uniref:Uncharacterized protein n=1 Tax=Geodermatophilus maliterrae TaxID=3162531 RepID=A0ABV3X8P2_9ACTN